MARLRVGLGCRGAVAGLIVCRQHRAGASHGTVRKHPRPGRSALACVVVEDAGRGLGTQAKPFPLRKSGAGNDQGQPNAAQKQRPRLFHDFNFRISHPETRQTISLYARGFNMNQSK